jgi:hypothetical protein
LLEKLIASPSFFVFVQSSSQVIYFVNKNVIFFQSKSFGHKTIHGFFTL